MDPMTYHFPKTFRTNKVISKLRCRYFEQIVLGYKYPHFYTLLAPSSLPLPHPFFHLHVPSVSLPSPYFLFHSGGVILFHSSSYGIPIAAASSSPFLLPSQHPFSYLPLSSLVCRSTSHFSSSQIFFPFHSDTVEVHSRIQCRQSPGAQCSFECEKNHMCAEEEN